MTIRAWRPTRRGRVGAVAALALLGGTVLISVPSTAQAAPWVAPRPLQITAAPSFPGVAAWGVAYNPVADEIAVGDYLSPQVRRFSRAGTYLGDFVNPGGTVGGVTSALAVDPRDGAYYVAITGEGRTSKSIRKYSATGQFLFDFNGVGGTNWLTVDAAGFVWQPTAYAGRKITQWQVDDATKTATVVRTISNPGTGPGQFNFLTGVATDAAGNVYVADSGNKTVHAYTGTGTWRFDVGTGRFPGDIRGVAVDDANALLYVANSQNGTIEAFTLAGTYVRTFGAPGAGPGQFTDGARQLAMAPGGNLLAADYGARRVLEFDGAGRYVSSLPDPVMSPDPAGLSSARGMSLDPATGDFVVADSWGQRILRFSPDGTLLDSHGRRGTAPPDGMNYPKATLVDPATGHVWVANYEGNPDIVVFSSDFSRVIRRIDTPRFVNDLELVGDSVYAVVRKPGAVNVYDRTTGALTRTFGTGLGLLRGVGVEPSTGNVWLTSDTSPQVFVLGPDGTRLRTATVDNRGWGVAVAGDVVYVSDTSANTVVAFDRATATRLGAFGGPGSKFGQLRGPSAIAVAADGTIHVIEERNGRVQSFGFGPAPAPESIAPVPVFAAQQLVGSQVVATGTVTDGTGVATVEVTVQDAVTGAYYNARSNTWTPSLTWSPAVRYGSLTASSWRFTTSLTLPGRSYTVKVRATDVLGKVSAPVTRTFVQP